MDTHNNLEIIPILKYLGLALALFFPACFIISMLGYFSGINFINIAFGLAVLVSLFFIYTMKLKRIVAIIIALLFVSSFVGCGLIASEFYANGFDSTYFHELIIISLKNGWNPVEYNVGIKIPEIEVLDVPDNFKTPLYNSVGTRTYAKSLHILFAAFFSAAGNLEAAKGLSFVGMLMVFSLCTVIYSKTFSNLSLIESGIWGFVTAACPVAITASSSFYLDGILYLSLLTIIAIFSLYIIEGKRYLLYMGLFHSIFFINIKHSALLFFIVTIAVFVILFLFYKTDSFSGLIKVFCLFSLFALIFSFHPYIQNVQKYGEPTGIGLDTSFSNFQDIPPGWSKLGTVEKFVRSVFSVETHNPSRYIGIRYPFLFDKNELEDYAFDEPGKIGAWGPLYSGILIFSLILFLFSFILFAFTNSYEKYTFLYLAIITTILITIVVFSLSWYTRYMPQAWLLPIFFAFPYLNIQNKGAKFIRVVILALLIVNIALVGCAYYSYQSDYSKQYSSSLETIKIHGNEVLITENKNNNHPIFLYSYLYKLVQQNTTINFKTDAELDQNYVKVWDSNFLVWVKK